MIGQVQQAEASIETLFRCNQKATAGAGCCSNKAIREEALDGIVLDGLLHRVLEPSRLELLLSNVLDRSGEAQSRRKEDLARVRRERIAAEARLGRLLDLAAEGLMRPRDPVFAGKLAEGRTSIGALAKTERSLSAQLGSAANVIDDAAVERFGQMLRTQIMDANSDLRRAYVRMMVGHVSVNDNEIVIAGSKAALEAAATSGSTAAKAVPSFDRDWCAYRTLVHSLRV